MTPRDLDPEDGAQDVDVSVHRRASIGDAPRWIAGIFLIGVFGSLGLCFVLFVVGQAAEDLGWMTDGSTATGWNRALLLVGVCATQVALLRGYLRRRPLDEVDRSYYRTAHSLLIPVSLGSHTIVGLISGLLLLAHSVLFDREVRQVKGVVPVTKRDREELTGERPVRRRPGRRGRR